MKTEGEDTFSQADTTTSAEREVRETTSLDSSLSSRPPRTNEIGLHFLDDVDYLTLPAPDLFFIPSKPQALKFGSRIAVSFALSATAYHPLYFKETIISYTYLICHVKAYGHDEWL